MIYGQNTLLAITFDLNEILTCIYFCWTLWVRAMVNYSYSRNTGNIKNFQGIFDQNDNNDKNNHSHTTHTYQLVVAHPLDLLKKVTGAGHVLTCTDVVPIGHVPQVSIPVQVSTQPTTGHVRA